MVTSGLKLGKLRGAEFDLAAGSHGDPVRMEKSKQSDVVLLLCKYCATWQLRAWADPSQTHRAKERRAVGQ